MPSLPRTALALALAGLVLSGCSGDEQGVTEDRTPEEVLALARTTLAETSGVNLSLTAHALPAGVTGLKAASGVGTDAPAFDGTITVVLSGADFDVPVVAVDGKVFAQIPLTPGWSDVDPAEYGAPDPARLMDPESGFASLLPATEDVAEGETVRGGRGNREVLTELTGTVPGEVVSNVIPSAKGDFDATYTVTDGGELREAVLTGVFYPGSDAMSYTIGFEAYGTERRITAP